VVRRSSHPRARPRFRPLGAALALAALLALALPPIAGAHLEFKPESATPGKARTFELEVPNERPSASTVGVEVQLPSGITEVSPRSLGGWTLKVTKGTAGDVARFSLKAGEPIGPGNKSRSFEISMKPPDKPGAVLVFKAIQTYDNGERVRWIGPPGTEEPAPRIELKQAAANPDEPVTSDGASGTTGATGASGATGATGAAAEQENSDSDDDGNDALVWVIVALAVVVVAGGGYAIYRSRRGRGPGAGEPPAAGGETPPSG
jgi:uncharacterized protein YcnI